MSLKCVHLDVLKLFLSKFSPTMESKPNGQSMYTFPCGLVLNVYETGSFHFQGTIANSVELQKQITSFIESTNAPFKS